MQIKTILNRVEKHPSFVYGKARFVAETEGSGIEIEIRPRANGRLICSGCSHDRPGYDTLAARRFEFVPLWGFRVFFWYAMRRVSCPTCGVVVERVPWAEGKHRLTTTYAWFLARWARRLSWSEVAAVFRTSWEHVFRSVEMAVEWGRAHMSLDGIRAIGVDEIQWKHGYRFLTLVYQLDGDTRRLLWIGLDRKVRTLLRFFRWFGKERSQRIEFICSDLWKPYLKVIAKKAAQAIHVLDRFHIMSHFSKAIDKVRAGEAKQMKAKGFDPVLKNTRWCLLKRPENLTEKQEATLADLLRFNLHSVRCYLLKEEFQLFWDYLYPAWAGKFLDRWCSRTMRSRIEPMKQVAKMLRSHRDLLLNWFRARGKISVGAVEAMNNKAKLTTRKAYGFREYRTLEVALYHTLGALPEPTFTHKFC